MKTTNQPGGQGSLTFSPKTDPAEPFTGSPMATRARQNDLAFACPRQSPLPL
ncbi:MAG: hypothetical protein P8X55_16965 [Desulfosarcinaceae bacterium]